MSNELAQVLKMAAELLEGEGQKAAGNSGGFSNPVLKHTLSGASNDMGRPLNEDAFFVDCALEAAICNAVIQPQESLLTFLPVRTSQFDSRKVGYITANDADFVLPADQGVCDPGITPASSISACKFDFPFGRLNLSTPTGEVDDLVKKACRGIYDDFFFVGDTRGISAFPSQMFTVNDRQFIVESAVRRSLRHNARAFQTWFLKTLWTGTPAMNLASGGYKEFLGLDALITDDYGTNPDLAPFLESSTGDPADCAALNSDVKDFEGTCVGGAASLGGIWTYMQQIEATLYMRAQMMGLLPTEWVWVMRPELWHELVKVIPCEMVGDGCAGATINANDGGSGMFNLAMRQQLLSSMSITTNGRSHRVITDDGIPYAQPGPTQYQSSIYLLPIRVAGEASLFVEHVDYRVANSVLSPIPGNQQDLLGWTDGGRYHHVIRAVNRCFEIDSKVEPRLVFKAPYLAGRIDNVLACPIQAIPTAFAPAA